MVRVGYKMSKKVKLQKNFFLRNTFSSMAYIRLPKNPSPLEKWGARWTLLVRGLYFLLPKLPQIVLLTTFNCDCIHYF